MQSVDVVTGPYDIIAVIEAADMRAIGTLLRRKYTLWAEWRVQSPASPLVGRSPSREREPFPH